MKHKILRIGHRGAAGHAPENTLAAIEQGIALGCDYVEIDIQQTADGQLVVIHDKRLNRTTSKDGIVTEFTLAELQTLDAGAGERIPQFSEVLERVNGRIGLMAEIITPGIADNVVRTVSQHRLSTPVIFASFLHPEILTIRELVPTAQTLALFEGVPVTGAQFALAARATHVGLGFDSVTEPFVRELHRNAMAVFVYTLDDRHDIGLARSMQVDGVVSNYPERV